MSSILVTGGLLPATDRSQPEPRREWRVARSGGGTWPNWAEGSTQGPDSVTRGEPRPPRVIRGSCTGDAWVIRGWYVADAWQTRAAGRGMSAGWCQVGWCQAEWCRPDRVSPTVSARPVSAQRWTGCRCCSRCRSWAPP